MSEYERGFAAGFERGYEAARRAVGVATYPMTTTTAPYVVSSGSTARYPADRDTQISFGMSENGVG
jgi:hypothetical protein